MKALRAILRKAGESGLADTLAGVQGGNQQRRVHHPARDEAPTDREAAPVVPEAV